MKINSIKLKIEKDIYIMKLKVDTNDADFKYHKIEIKKEDIPHIKSICKALTKLAYIHRDRDFEPPKSFHNYPSGGRYGYTMERICKCSAKDNLIEGGLKNEESFKIFDGYMGKKTFHTIHQIDINDNNLFISNHWSSWGAKKKIEKKKNLQ